MAITQLPTCWYARQYVEVSNFRPNYFLQSSPFLHGNPLSASFLLFSVHYSRIPGHCRFHVVQGKVPITPVNILRFTAV